MPIRSNLVKLSAVFALLAMIFVPSGSSAQEIWFGPLLPRAPWIHLDGVSDWSGLFKSRSGWENVSRRIGVLKLHPAYIADASDQELAALVADLERLGIAVGMEVNAVATHPSDKCGVTEGYDDPASVARVIAKMQRLHVIPKYVAFDEPVWFGHYAEGPKECGLPIHEVALRTVEIAQQYLTAFPAVVFGDIETTASLMLHTDWEANYQGFKQELEQGLGHKLAFVQLDVDWRNPSAAEQVATFANFARTFGMGLGIIYNGDGEDEDDAAWTAHAKENFTLIESASGIIPSQAIFQSWNRFPRRVLPETSPSSHSWLIAQYILPRTRFSWSNRDGQVSGRLIGSDGTAVPNAPMDVEVLGTSLTQTPKVRVVSGVVPENASFGIIGMRINQECLCGGSNDLVIGDFSYMESGGGSVAETFSFPSEAARQRGPRPDGVGLQTFSVGDSLLAHITVGSSQCFGFNSPAFVVTQHARFTFTAPIGSLDGKGMFGTATIIWLDAGKKGFQRTNIKLAHDVGATETVRTGATGNFVVNRPIDLSGKAAVLRLHFPGTPALRGAYADVR
jgi:hypothetical protein